MQITLPYPLWVYIVMFVLDQLLICKLWLNILNWIIGTSILMDWPKFTYGHGMFWNMRFSGYLKLPTYILLYWLRGDSYDFKITIAESNLSVSNIYLSFTIQDYSIFSICHVIEARTQLFWDRQYSHSRNIY